MKTLYRLLFPQLLLCIILIPNCVNSQEINHWIAYDDSEKFGGVLSNYRTYAIDHQGQIYSIKNVGKLGRREHKKQHFVGFDQKGQKIIDRLLPLNRRVIGLAIDRQGNVFFTGEIITESGERQLFVEKQTLQGRPLWQKVWGGPGTDYGGQIEVLNDGGVIILGGLGADEKSQNYPVEVQIGKEKVSFTSLKERVKCLIRMGSEGEVKWVKTIKMPYKDTGNLSLKIGLNDDFYLSVLAAFFHQQRSQEPISKHPMYFGEEMIFLKKIDDHLIIRVAGNGELASTTIIPFSQFPSHFIDFAVDGHRNIILIGNISRSLFGRVPAQLPKHLRVGILLAKYFETGELHWEKVLGARYGGRLPPSLRIGPKNEIYFSTVLNSTSHIGCGYGAVPDSSDIYWDGHILEEIEGSKSYLAAYNEEGQLLWRESPTNSARLKISPTQTGLWVWLEPRVTCQFGGIAFGDEDNLLNYLIYYSLPGQELQASSEPTPPLQVFPNTSPDRFQLSLGAAFSGEVKLSIADATGRTILQRTLHKEENLLQTEVDLGRFAEGNYVLHLSDGWETASKKLVVRR